MASMIDHVSITVLDLIRAGRFYDAIMAALGWRSRRIFNHEVTKDTKGPRMHLRLRVLRVFVVHPSRRFAARQRNATSV
jgi:hypothetical protein